MLKNISKKKKKKSVKQSKLIPYQPKTFENPKVLYIKLIIAEHPKTSYKLSKIIRQAEKVGSYSSLYIGIKQVKIF